MGGQGPKGGAGSIRGRAVLPVCARAVLPVFDARRSREWVFDNGDARLTVTGTWFQRNRSNAYGGSFLGSNGAPNLAVFFPAGVLPNGQYEVQVAWQAAAADAKSSGRHITLV